MIISLIADDFRCLVYIFRLSINVYIKVDCSSSMYTFTVSTIVVCGRMPFSLSVWQIMALVVIGVGVPVTLLFQVFIHEDPNARLPKKKWYKWIMDPRFYLVGQNGRRHTIDVCWQRRVSCVCGLNRMCNCVIPLLALSVYLYLLSRLHVAL